MDYRVAVMLDLSELSTQYNIAVSLKLGKVKNIDLGKASIKKNKKGQLIDLFYFEI